MLENISTTVRRISAKISAEELALAKAYMQGAVHSFCGCNGDREFSVRTLFGGTNRDWSDTPLQWIYEYHKSAGKPDPAEAAAKDVGWLFKQVLLDDVRTFRYVRDDTGNVYQRIDR